MMPRTSARSLQATYLAEVQQHTLKYSQLYIIYDMSGYVQVLSLLKHVYPRFDGTTMIVPQKHELQAQTNPDQQVIAQAKRDRFVPDIFIT